jgi:hypothetical protein
MSFGCNVRPGIVFGKIALPALIGIILRICFRGFMEFFKDLLRFILKRKQIWLVPVILSILLFAVLIILSSSPTAASFIYAIF